ncbi:hypothetical protein SAMN05421827_11575 [Pedobacter terrae]|uniref:ABC-three component systems C-terminal domain-containing protein n=1 Tax=Pedobacter terrae TaxID=405671 RepID=A0A1G7Z544_9SPHI|nr:ABC-three component system protein [Pedobacter terrae]SDH03843.1 hypothetical protein SAMN05421827_11575 [Pedobacter terrae]
MTLDEIRPYVVILNEGSGFFFQPMDINATYILTAKHVIQNAGNAIHLLKRFTESVGGLISEDLEYTMQPGINYFEHPERDVAILKIDRLQGLSQVIRTDDVTVDRESYILAGYPQMRRDIENDPNYHNAYRTDEGITIQGPRNNSLREARIPDRPGLDEVRGHSGGGLGKFDDGFFLLAGIQSQMIGAMDEQLGKIEFSPMSSFDSLVALYPEQLTSLDPAHLGCFSFIQDATFLLRVNLFNEENIAYTRNFLKAETEKIINSGTAPHHIRRYFNKRLLLDQANPNVLNGRNIWIAWLEFLTIVNIMEYTDVEEADLKQLFNSFRLLYSDTKDDWTVEVQKMIQADYHGLPSGGVVVIGTNSSPLDGLYEIEAKRIPNLLRVTNKKLMQTDNGINFPFDHYRFVHLDSFKKKCITDKIAEYSNIFDEQELIIKLQGEYEQYITRNQN